MTRTLYNEDIPISGSLLIDALKAAAESDTWFRKMFGLSWIIHYHDDRKLGRVRIYRNQSGRNMGDPKNSYVFFVTTSHKLCRPLAIDREETYSTLYLAVDSWGVNFQIQQESNENFVDECNVQSRYLEAAIRKQINLALGQA